MLLLHYQAPLNLFYLEIDIVDKGSKDIVAGPNTLVQPDLTSVEDWLESMWRIEQFTRAYRPDQRFKKKQEKRKPRKRTVALIAPWSCGRSTNKIGRQWSNP